MTCLYLIFSTEFAFFHFSDVGWNILSWSFHSFKLSDKLVIALEIIDWTLAIGVIL